MNRLKIKEVEQAQEKLNNTQLAKKSTMIQYIVVILLSCVSVLFIAVHYHSLPVKTIALAVWAIGMMFLHFHLKKQLKEFLHFLIDEARIPLNADTDAILQKYDVSASPNATFEDFIEQQNVSADDAKRLMLFSESQVRLNGIRVTRSLLKFTSIVTIVIFPILLLLVK